MDLTKDPGKQPKVLILGIVMATRKKQKRELNHEIAELKSKSFEQIVAKFAAALAKGAVHTLPGSTVIVRPQRVDS